MTDLDLLLPERITSKITQQDGCWSWGGRHQNGGYPYVRWNGRWMGLHRVVMAVRGHDIDGMDVDHLCRNPGCMNPDHLEVVTHAENMDRTRPDRCRRAGHDWSDPKNVYVRANGRRYCAECSRRDARERNARRGS